MTLRSWKAKLGTGLIAAVAAVGLVACEDEREGIEREGTVEEPIIGERGEDQGLFDRFDGDRDGFVTEEEYRGGYGLLDRNGDRRLEREELGD